MRMRPPTVHVVAVAFPLLALLGCQGDDHHARKDSDSDYARSRPAGGRVDGDSTYRSTADVEAPGRIDIRTDTDLRRRSTNPPVDNASGAGVGGANEGAATLSQPGTSGTRAPTQSANPDPHANTPRDVRDVDRR